MLHKNVQNTFKRKLFETIICRVSAYASVYKLITAQYVWPPLQAKKKASWEILEVHSLQFQQSHKNTRKFFGKFSPNSCQAHWHFSYYTHCCSLHFHGECTIFSSVRVCALTRKEDAFELRADEWLGCCAWRLLCQPLTSVPVQPTLHG